MKDLKRRSEKVKYKFEFRANTFIFFLISLEAYEIDEYKKVDQAFSNTQKPKAKATRRKSITVLKGKANNESAPQLLSPHSSTPKQVKPSTSKPIFKIDSDSSADEADESVDENDEISVQNIGLQEASQKQLAILK